MSDWYTESGTLMVRKILLAAAHNLFGVVVG